MTDDEIVWPQLASALYVDEMRNRGSACERNGRLLSRGHRNVERCRGPISNVFL